VLVQLSRWGPAGLAAGLDVEGLKRTLEAGASQLSLAPESVLVLTLTNDAHVQEYNRRYRQLDEPTDVLAFAAQEKPTDQRFLPPPGTKDWLGDVVISLERARKQAREAGHPLDDEVRLLAVHGLLHLLGYDHATDPQELKMTSLTKKVLEAGK
jgi:probable rRNA maturation factor